MSNPQAPNDEPDVIAWLLGAVNEHVKRGGRVILFGRDLGGEAPPAEHDLSTALPERTEDT